MLGRCSMPCNELGLTRIEGLQPSVFSSAVCSNDKLEGRDGARDDDGREFGADSNPPEPAALHDEQQVAVVHRDQWCSAMMRRFVKS